ncbi:MAG TPA: hypothetical protein VGM88_13945 [Kofleriaceae bacterium]
MRTPCLILFLALLGACGEEIGDSCITDTDCATDGSRQCDVNSSGGYCTMIGCDYNTCPGEAECVSFYSGTFENEPCSTAADCSLDEVCTIDGFCSPRSSEVRYCMKKCGDNGDCRDDYECRAFDEQVRDGGQVVLDPTTYSDFGASGSDGNPLPTKQQAEMEASGFCAPAPASSGNDS